MLFIQQIKIINQTKQNKANTRGHCLKAVSICGVINILDFNRMCVLLILFILGVGSVKHLFVIWFCIHFIANEKQACY